MSSQGTQEPKLEDSQPKLQESVKPSPSPVQEQSQMSLRESEGSGSAQIIVDHNNIQILMDADKQSPNLNVTPNVEASSPDKTEPMSSEAKTLVMNENQHLDDYLDEKLSPPRADI